MQNYVILDAAVDEMTYSIKNELDGQIMKELNNCAFWTKKKIKSKVKRRIWFYPKWFG